MSIISMESLAAQGQLQGKKVLIREDLNVPVKDGKVINDARIRAALPSVKMALDSGATVIVMSHLGRPSEGVAIADQPEFSMTPVASMFADLLGVEVPIMPSDFSADDAAGLQAGQCVLLENVRANIGEKADTDELSQYYASLCDVFVMDAFGTAHRAQASTHGVAKFASIACAGPLLMAELDALSKALENPDRPLLAVVGGAKVSTKLGVLESLADKVDALIVGGGIANTFLAAAGLPVGKSLFEEEMLDNARAIMAKTTIPLPVDVAVATEFSETAVATIKKVEDVTEDDMILDIGPESIEVLKATVAEAGTILWNGPLGVFEFPSFEAGTSALAEAIALNSGFSIAGGGETITAIEKYNISEQVSYISTGGGAFLEFVQGDKLPAVAILETRATQ